MYDESEGVGLLISDLKHNETLTLKLPHTLQFIGKSQPDVLGHNISCTQNKTSTSFSACFITFRTVRVCLIGKISSFIRDIQSKFVISN